MNEPRLNLVLNREQAILLIDSLSNALVKQPDARVFCVELDPPQSDEIAAAAKLTGTADLPQLQERSTTNRPRGS